MFKNNYGNNATAFEGQEESIEDPPSVGGSKRGPLACKTLFDGSFKAKGLSNLTQRHRFSKRPGNFEANTINKK